MAEEGMLIEFVRSGGFAGTRVRASVDTGELSAEEASELERLVERLNLSALAQLSPAHARGADRFQYDITITRGPERHRLSLGESQVPPELQKLIDRLMAMARRGR